MLMSGKNSQQPDVSPSTPQAWLVNFLRVPHPKRGSSMDASGWHDMHVEQWSHASMAAVGLKRRAGNTKKAFMIDHTSPLFALC
jgi:hypothetical protein